MPSPRSSGHPLTWFEAGSPRARVAGPFSSWLKKLSTSEAAGPFFIPDLSSWEGNAPNFAAIAQQPNMVGCIIKVSEGMSPGISLKDGHDINWFAKNWPRVREAGGDRYGKSWFRGGYCYGWPSPSGAAQADYALDTIERAGGWGEGDMPLAWDLEGSKWTSRQQVIDVSASFAERVFQRTQRRAVLYTGSTWRDFGIKEQLGFGSMWSPHMNLAANGWPNSSFSLWQFVGDGKYWDLGSTAAKAGWPVRIPGLDAKVDMNVVIDGGVPAMTMERVRVVLTGGANLGTSWAPSPENPPLASPPATRTPSTPTPAREGGGLSTPVAIGIGAGLLVLGVALSSLSRSDGYL